MKSNHGDFTNEELATLPTEKLIAIIKSLQDEDNFITMTDSYKMTHHLLYPEGLEEVYSYMEPRGGDMPYTVLFGLQYYIKRYMTGVRITAEKIEAARKLNIAHFGFDCFDDKMWYHIVNECGGKLPLEIKAIPEGTAVSVKNVIVTIRNTDKKCAALTNISETLLMKIWATNTVAAYARIVKELIYRYHSLTSTAPEFLIDFMHHDFGYRGVSSEETARLMGAAGLTSFKGTDTLGAIVLTNDYYDEPMAGFSVIASEHSVMASYGGRDQEADAYKKIIQRVKEKCANVNPASGVIILSLVSDTYNIYNVCSKILPDLKEEFIGWTNNHGIPIKIVIRPDSGDAKTVLFGYDKHCRELETLSTKVAADMKMTLTQAYNLVERGIFNILFEKFEHTTNNKNFKVLHPQIGVLQGDGISLTTIKELYEIMVVKKIDIMNLVLGSGGKYLQAHDRDEQKYAIKATHVIISGQGINIEKDPITDSGKKSKKGYLKLVYAELGKEHHNDRWKNYMTVQSGSKGYDTFIDCLQTVFLNGELTKEYTFAEIRENTKVISIQKEMETV